MKKLLLSAFGIFAALSMNAQINQLLADTSLEVTGGGGTDWTSTSTNFGTVLCDAASCGTCGGPCVPATGTWYAWFGGAGAAEDGTLDQTFNVTTAGAALVKFQFALALPSGSALDSMYMKLDNNTMWTSSGVDSLTYGTTYQTVTVPVSNLSTGSHTMSFVGHESGSAPTTYNALVDDITLWMGNGVGFTEFNFNEGVTLSTNSQNHTLNVAFNLPKAMNMSIVVTDMMGRRVASQDLQDVTNNYISFNTIEFGAGVYNVMISNGFTAKTHKVAIQ